MLVVPYPSILFVLQFLRDPYSLYVFSPFPLPFATPFYFTKYSSGSLPNDSYTPSTRNRHRPPFCNVLSLALPRLRLYTNYLSLI